jgi:anti-sigma factor RsiW
MENCGEIRKRLTPYLEGMLEGEEASSVQAHLQGCPSCRAVFEGEEQFVRTLRENLRGASAPPGLKEEIRSLLRRERSGRRFSKRTARFVLGGALAASFVFSLAFLILARRPADLGPLDLGWTVAAHRGVETHQAALEVETSDPIALTRWFSGRTDAVFSLPDRIPTELRLVGGRVIRHGGLRAAQVVFESDQGESSLFLLPSGSIRPRGESIHFGGLRFYKGTEGGYHLLAWSANEASYVLVAKGTDGAKRGCLLCHGGGEIKLPLSEFYRKL